MGSKIYQFDLMLSYAREDREEFVIPLVQALREAGHKVWFDDDEISLGESISESIERGLKSSRHILCIISAHYLKKRWPMNELRYFVANEIQSGSRLIPIWHQISFDEVSELGPLLLDRFAATSSLPLAQLVSMISRAIIKRKSNTNIPDPSLLVHRGDALVDVLQWIDGRAPLPKVLPETESIFSDTGIHDFLPDGVVDESRSLLSGPTTSILVVEDESAIAELIAISLRRIEGVDVDFAKDADEVFSLLKIRPYDLVTLDWMLPGRSGFSIAAEITLFYPGTPFIFLTARSEVVDKDCTRNYPHAGYITKPFGTQDLINRVRDIVSEAGLFALVSKDLQLGFHNYRIIYESASIAYDLCKQFNGHGRFDASFRHKIKNCFQNFFQAHATTSTDIAAATALLSQVSRLKQLGELGLLATRKKRRKKPSLKEFVDAYIQDRVFARGNITLSMQIPSKIMLDDDADLFARLCLVELIDNACESTKEALSITIVGRVRPTSKDLAFKVSNSGPAISPDMARLLFNEGYSTKGQQRGMGLPLMRELAANFGGMLELKQTDPVSFFFSIPYDKTDC